MEDKLRQVLSEVFEMEEEEISEDLGPEHVALWDSLHHLKMVTELERSFRIKLTMKEIRSMTTFGRIRELLNSRLAQTEPPGVQDQPDVLRK